MRSPMAVRLDIRPRLTLRDTRVTKARRRFRLPPLALPAAAYWVAMGGLTYVFAHLGEHPLETASAAELAPPPPPPPEAAPAPIARAPEPVARPATVTSYDPAEETPTETPAAQSAVEPDRDRGRD